MQRSLKQLATYLLGSSNGHGPFIIAVDGLGGSGKSSFAERIKVLLPESLIVHLDDFYLSGSDPMVVGSNFDWERLVRQVLKPVRKGGRAVFRTFNWMTHKLDEWKFIHGEKYIIIEGVTSGRSELRQYLDFIIFVDAPYETRLKRGVERDGMVSKELWMNDWMPRETQYLESDIHKPMESANLVVDGTYENADDVYAFETIREKDEYFT